MWEVIKLAAEEQSIVNDASDTLFSSWLPVPDCSWPFYWGWLPGYAAPQAVCSCHGSSCSSTSITSPIKAMRLTRPTATAGMIESDWNFFLHEWARYTRLTEIKDEILHDELWSFMEESFRQLAFSDYPSSFSTCSSLASDDAWCSRRTSPSRRSRPGSRTPPVTAGWLKPALKLAVLVHWEDLLPRCNVGTHWPKQCRPPHSAPTRVVGPNDLPCKCLKKSPPPTDKPTLRCSPTEANLPSWRNKFSTGSRALG